MGDLMRPIKFSDLIQRVLYEYEQKKSIYNISNIYKSNSNKALSIFGNKIENPLGVAAGPHTQLAQNILACYISGARFIELKTVQIMEGEELGIQKPCIRCDDEAYNCEWSTELSVKEALDEYIKAWIACKVIAKELELGDPNSFVFNMSCGYNLAGISSPKIDSFIEGLKDSSKVAIWQECLDYLKSNISNFKNIDNEFIDSISPHICNSITLSTMHGCPPKEIEEITSYLINVKKINTYIKCNPTLLGFDYVRKILDDMGYDYVKFGKHQFDIDLNIEAAIPMIKRLQAEAKAKNLTFGVKLTNTFQVQINKNELPGNDMYMSGKALYPLTISVAKLLSKEFNGTLPMSFSGGADKNNIVEIFNAGIWPITVCTVLLRPKGYDNLKPLVDKLEAEEYPDTQKPDYNKISELAEKVRSDKNYMKSARARELTEKAISYETPRATTYTCRTLCKGCVMVCPNRANEFLKVGDKTIILHIDSSCNECGNCQFVCVEPCLPYRDRITLFDNKEDFLNSDNVGILVADNIMAYRWDGVVKECDGETLPGILKEVYGAIKEQHRYYTK